MPPPVRIGLRGSILANKGGELMYMTVEQELCARIEARVIVCEKKPFEQPVDAIVDVSGYGYASTIPWGSPSFLSALAVRRHAPHVPWFFAPQALGPFIGLEAEARELFANSVVYARDAQSLAHMRTLDAPGCTVVAATDMTWVAQGDAAQGRAVLERHGIRPDESLIVLSPNMRVFERDPAYVQTLRTCIETAKPHAQVLLLPHELRDDHPDDRTLCRQLDAPVILEEQSAHVYKGMMAYVDMLIGSRYHLLVSALSYGVPVLAIGWSEKYAELLQELSLEAYGLSSSAPPAVVREQLLQTWNNRETLREAIGIRVERKKQQAADLFDDLAQRLSDDVQRTESAPFVSAMQKGLRKHAEPQGRYFLLRRNIHRLEKGMLLSDWHETRQEFGGNYVDETVEALQLCRAEIDRPTLDWSIAILSAFFDRFPSQQDGAAFRSYQTILAAVSPQQSSDASVPYRADTRPATTVSFSDFQTLCARRRSIRFFTEQIPEESDILACMDIALQAPSACNRQSFRFVSVRDATTIERLCAIAPGSRPIRPPLLLAVIGMYHGYADARDIKCPIIDASMAVMNLLLALETKGLASVCLNFPEVADMYAAFDAVVPLQDDEIVIMLIGVGYAAPRGNVAFSAKRRARDVVHKPSSLESHPADPIPDRA